jgi:hypothetical protein
MIIYTSAFVLSAEAAGTPLFYPRIGYATHTRDDGVIVTASTETDAGPKDMPLEPSTFGYWQASALPATWEIDFGATRSIDYVGIAEHTIGSSGAAVDIETSMGDTVGSPPVQVWTALAAGVSPADDAPLLFLDDARNARYMRITLTGSGAVPKLGVVYAGLALAMPRGPEMGFVPPNLSRTTELSNTMSRGGQFLGQGIKKMGVAASVSFGRLEHDFYRESVDPFVKSARQFPYFFAWCPSLYPLEVAYAWTGEDIHPSYSEWDQFSVSWSMIGIGQE